MNSQGLPDIEESLQHLTQRTEQDNRKKEMQKKKQIMLRAEENLTRKKNSYKL